VKVRLKTNFKMTCLRVDMVESSRKLVGPGCMLSWLGDRFGDRGKNNPLQTAAVSVKSQEKAGHRRRREVLPQKAVPMKKAE